MQSDPIGLWAGLNTYGYVSQNPIASIDPIGLTEINLGQGFTGIIDTFNFRGEASFEIHVFNSNGKEVGVYGPDGWINKHTFRGPPKDLPSEVENRCRGVAADKLRAQGKLPPKGQANIKGKALKNVVKSLPFIGPASEIVSTPSPETACELDPGFDAC